MIRLLIAITLYTNATHVATEVWPFCCKGEPEIAGFVLQSLKVYIFRFLAVKVSGIDIR
jgi:hypothetical protein